MSRSAIALCILGMFVSSITIHPVQAQSQNQAVPHLIRFNGVARDSNGFPIQGIAGATFALYKEEQGGVPLWLETQNIQADSSGHYIVQLGATKTSGLPAELFINGEARWLGVSINGAAEQSRVLLLSVPYALKAADAETVGGLPASAFVLATALVPPPDSKSPPSAPNQVAGSGLNIGGSGGQNYIPIWVDNNGNLGNSALYQTGTGSSAKVGIGLTNPLAALDVKGNTYIRGVLEPITKGYATANKGYNSNPLDLEASSFNSNTQKPVMQHFEWQAEPAANNTSNPSATLNLLFGQDTNPPAETGLKLSSTGLLTFASGQTFPGTGTITGITTASGSGLMGGANTGNVTLSLTNLCSANQVLQWNGTSWVCSSAGTGTITQVNAGTDLTGGGNSGSITLNLDTTKVPQLNSANSFNGNQSVTGNISATGTASAGIVNAGTSFNLAGSLFAFGSTTNFNSYIGFSGNAGSTGLGNTANGFGNLSVDTSGGFNTADGAYTLFSNTKGNFNTGTGFNTLGLNTEGNGNTAVGAYVLQSNITGNNNTGVGGGALSVNTADNNTAIGVNALLISNSGTNNTAVGGNALSNNVTGSYNTAIGYNAGPDNKSQGLINATAIGANAVVSESNAIVLGGTPPNAVNVGIGTPVPLYTLDVQGTGNFTGPVTFSAGQTFPNTVSSVVAGTDLTNTGSASNVVLNVDTTKVVTGITAGTGLAGGGVGGTPTLNVDTTKVPLLSANNTFSGINTFTQSQIVQGNLSVGLGTVPVTEQIYGKENGGTGIQNVTTNASTSGNSFAVVAAASAAGVTTEIASDGLGTGPLGTPSGYFGTYTNQPIGFITANVKRMLIDTAGNINISKKITAYNGIPTVGNGVPSIVASVNQTGATGSFILPLFTPASTGLFRVSVYLICTSVPGELEAGVYYTEPTQPVTQQLSLRDNNFDNIISCLDDPAWGTFVVRNQGGKPIEFSAGPITGSPTFDFMVTVEQLL